GRGLGQRGRTRAAGRGLPGQHELRDAGIRRTVSSRRRQAASLRLHGLRARRRQARPPRERDRGVRRLQPARAPARQDDVDRAVRPLTASPTRPRQRSPRVRRSDPSTGFVRLRSWAAALILLFVIAAAWRWVWLARLARTPFADRLDVDARIYWAWSDHIL